MDSKELKWGDTPPLDFDWGSPAPMCCWVTPNIWGDSEPALGELSTHIYPDRDGECGIIINTVNGAIDVKDDPTERRYCLVPQPNPEEWDITPPVEKGWYFLKASEDSIVLVSVYEDPQTLELVYTGIDWPTFAISKVASATGSWIRIPLPS